MGSIFHLDFETRSVLDLRVVGVDRYVKHPSTKILLLSFAENDNKVEQWQPHLNPKLPSVVDDAVHDRDVIIHAFNATFERNVFNKLLNIWIEYNRWVDSMIWARHMSMPGGLEDVGKTLGLPPSQMKLAAEGERLIQMFSLPVHAGGEKTLFGISQPVFRDWKSDPKDWEIFCDYNKMDTVSERAVLHKMKKFPLPPLEQRGWVLDQKINDFGMPTDMQMVDGSLKIAMQVKADLLKQIKDITNLENPNSNPQILGWIKERGYSFGSLEKPMVARALNGECPLTPEAKQVLNIRKQASKTSYKKLSALKEVISDDGMLRDQFAFMGSARAGRWSGHTVQLHNLPRPVKEVEKNMSRALELLKAGDLVSLSLEFDTPPMEIIASCLRGMFRAPEGYHFDVCDLNAIENRGLGWVARCPAILDVFKNKRDPYIDFAVDMYKQPYEVLYAEWKAGDSTKRQNAKPAVLGAGYRLGGGEEKENPDGDIIKTGLWGYAEAMGVKMTKEEAHLSVKVFREKFKEVVQLWYDLENASMKAVRTGKPQTVGPVTFQAFGKKLLRILLPSGRGLHYIHPKIENIAFGNYGEKPTLTYEGIDLDTKQWTRITTHGGKLTENIVQAISRDILLNGMFEAEKIGIKIAGHIHDEIISLTKNDSGQKLQDLRQCMIKSPIWAPDFPIDADGYSSNYYRKG